MSGGVRLTMLPIRQARRAGRGANTDGGFGPKPGGGEAACFASAQDAMAFNADSRPTMLREQVGREYHGGAGLHNKRECRGSRSRGGNGKEKQGWAGG